MKKILIAFLATALLIISAVAQDKKTASLKVKNLDKFTKNLRKIDGFLPLFYDGEKGQNLF